MVKEDSKTNESMDKLVGLLEQALSNEEVIGKIAEKVAFRMGAPRAEVPVTQFWKENLDKAGIDLEEGCTPERIVELYPLAHQEIEGVANQIKTEKFTGQLNLDILKGHIVKFLGDKALIDRVAGIVVVEGKRKIFDYYFKYPCSSGPGEFPDICIRRYEFGSPCGGSSFVPHCPGFFDPVPLDWREQYINPVELERMAAQRQQMYGGGHEAQYRTRAQEPRTSLYPGCLPIGSYSPQPPNLCNTHTAYQWDCNDRPYCVCGEGYRFPITCGSYRFQY
ncbi:MAG: hypothetical protein GY855_01545 [candidate division Zixibacteria bacterium]|nr:hypothetical protein [candidate division Zixibacteria bacterium]